VKNTIYPKIVFSNQIFVEGVILNTDNEVIEGLVVLEYLNIGIMPFYPFNPGISTADKKAKRKFRKMWRKIAKNSNVLKYYVTLGEKKHPSKAKMWKRKILVHDWIKDKVRKKYDID
jgi:hypothetical protein